MQTVSAALKAALIDIDARVNPRTLVDLVELYASDYLPGAGGFDPADAIEKFAAESLTWNGFAYRREMVSRSEIVRNFGEKTNSVTLTFSNISRYLATLAQTQTIEGLFIVVRCVVPSVTDDSLVLFVGRCEKPSDIDKKTFSMSARQDFGNINQTLPPAKFLPDDPNGRLPSDPLFEGFRTLAVPGSFQFQPPGSGGGIGLLGGLIGLLFGRKKKPSQVTQQWSSVDGTPWGNPVAEVFGRCQIQGVPIIFQDRGDYGAAMYVWCKGPISAIENPTLKEAGRRLGNVINHLGDLGGTGSNSTEDTGLAQGIGFLSLTAYSSISFYSDAAVVDDPLTLVSIIRGRLVPLPNTSGVYGASGWSDNPVHVARFILTHPNFIGIAPEFMEDSVNYLTSLHCDEPLVDDTNDQVIMIPNPDLAQAGTGFYRYRSTGIYDSSYWRFYHFSGPDAPELQDGPYTGFDTTDYPTTFAVQHILRKRYTVSFPITEEVRGVDLLYKTVLPAFKGYIKVNKKGKYEIRSEKPSDATFLRTATAVGATSIPVLDVTPWKTGPDLLQGRIVLGFGLSTSEVRDVISADFSTSGNSITLTSGATGGGATATASGATLTGGSTTVQASGTVTIGGSPAAGNVITATINGIAVSYTLDSTDTTGTAAAMLGAYINANQRLNKYIKTTWTSASPTVVTIKALHGALNVSALWLAHTTAIADPSAAPTVAASGSGSLAAGTYQVAYADLNTIGSTYITPNASVVLTASQKIDVSSLPAFPTGVVARNFYISEEPNSTRLRFVVTRIDAASFSINGLPDPGAALPPSYNSTAEELIRVAMSFATNSQDVYGVWPASTLLILNDIYLPSVPNGHKYKVTTAGTTGATEPTWPTGAGATVTSGSVTFTEFGATVLGQAGLTRANIVKDSFKWPLNRQSSVNQVKINYRDAKNDFALTPYRVNDKPHQLQVGKVYPLEVDGSAIDNFHQMFRIANWTLSKNREGDWFNTLKTGPQGLVLEEGDVICASDDSGGLVNEVTRIEELRIDKDHNVTISQARRYSTLMFSDDAASHTIPMPTTLRFSQTVNSIVNFIDNFPIRDQDAETAGFYVNVSRDLTIEGDWRGWTLYADYGDGYAPIADGDIPGIVGTCTTTLGTPTDYTVWDRTNSVTFTLAYGPTSPAPQPFVTVTEDEVLANIHRNLFLVGNEYLQAAHVTWNGGQSYTIDTLLRGRFGTSTTELTHSASERVVFLDGTEQFVTIDVARLNVPFNYKAVTTNQDVADATPVSFTWTGGTLRPKAPTNLKKYLDAQNNALFDWARRSRISPNWHDLSDVPLGEEVERYLIEAYNSGGSLVHSVIVGIRDTALPVMWKPGWLNGSTPVIATDGSGTVYRDPPTLGPFGSLIFSQQQINGDFVFEFEVFTSDGSTWGLPESVAVVPSLAEDVSSPAAWLGSWSSLFNLKTSPDNVTFHDAVASDRFAIEYRSGMVYFYKNHHGSETAPLLSQVAPQVYAPYEIRVLFTLSQPPPFGVATRTGLKNPRLIRETAEWMFPAADQTALGLTPGTPIHLKIYQISALVGRGAPLDITL